MRNTFLVSLKRFIAGATDPFNNPIVGYEPPVDLPIFGLAPYGSTEPSQDRDETDTRLEVFCPPGTAISPRDVLVVNDLDYEVVGEVADFTRGPYMRQIGVVYTVRRVEG